MLDTTGDVQRGQTRAAIYIRVSTRDKGQDTENQAQQLREFCGAQRWQVVEVYEDLDSGAKGDRSRFVAMMADASRRKLDVLVFWALDRLTREGALETLQYLNQLSNHGVGFRSFSEPYLDSCGIFKDAVIAILGTVAKQERVRLAERVRAGLASARREGTRSGKPPGRPRVILCRDQIDQLRREGLSWRLVARRVGGSIGSLRRAHAEFMASSRPCQNPAPEEARRTPQTTPVPTQWCRAASTGPRSTDRQRRAAPAGWLDAVRYDQNPSSPNYDS